MKNGNLKADALKKADEELKLEEIFAQLDQVVADMEKGDISLEESFQMYHKGMELLKQCNEKIDNIEKKMILLDNEGEEHEFEN